MNSKIILFPGTSSGVGKSLHLKKLTTKKSKMEFEKKEKEYWETIKQMSGRYNNKP